MNYFIQKKWLYPCWFLIIIGFVFLGTPKTMGSKPEKRSLVIEITAGSNYDHEYKYGLLKLNLTPQIAIWLEDSKNNYIDTIFVTAKTAKSGWGNVRRPSALPIWSHQRGVRYADGLFTPDKKNPLPDAITGATAKNSFVKVWNIPSNIPNGEYLIKVEVNNSFDYNDKYRDKLSEKNPDYNDVSGQPSLLWEGIIVVGKSSEINLVKTGHGHPSGKNGNIDKDLSGFTTALNIINAIQVKVENSKGE